MKKVLSWDEVLKLPTDGGKVIIIFGHRRKGKSGLAWWLLEKFSKRYTSMVPVVLGMPKTKRRLVPKTIRHVDDLLKLPKKGIILVDEAALRFSARRSQQDESLIMAAVIALSGQKQQAIIFVAHTARMLEVEQIFDSDLIIYKLPSAAHVKFERRETAAYTAAARKALARQTDPRQWAYLIDFHDDRTGLLKNPLPTFWTKDLSMAWGDLNVEDLIRSGKSGKKTNGGIILG